ncbi:MAG: hypothetical protein QM730_27025 [Anaerolineales bacterium]
MPEILSFQEQLNVERSYLLNKKQHLSILPYPVWSDTNRPKVYKKTRGVFNHSPQGIGGGGSNRNFARTNKLDLTEVTDTDVEMAMQFFGPQLRTAWDHNLIKKQRFCTIRLVGNGGPAVIFGRVSTCYPHDGEIRSIRQMDILFPRLETEPAIVTVTEKDILSDDFGDPPTSYLFRIQILGDAEDGSEFEGKDEDFQKKGFSAELNYEFDDLQSFHIQSDEQKFSMPWVYVISSRWISMLPKDIYAVVFANLKNILMQRNRIIINYHPDGYSSLNKVFKLRPGVSPIWFHDADTVDDVLDITEQTFNSLIMRPLSSLILQ